MGAPASLRAARYGGTVVSVYEGRVLSSSPITTWLSKQVPGRLVKQQTSLRDVAHGHLTRTTVWCVPVHQEEEKAWAPGSRTPFPRSDPPNDPERDAGSHSNFYNVLLVCHAKCTMIRGDFRYLTAWYKL